MPHSLTDTATEVGPSLKVLAIEHEVAGTTDERIESHLKAEAARSWELYRSGIIREMYFRAAREEAIVVPECITARDAESTLKTLPLL